VNSDEATVAVIDALQTLDIPYIQRLDWNYIRRWCDAHGTRQLFDTVRASTLRFHANDPILPSGTP